MWKRSRRPAEYDGGTFYMLLMGTDKSAAREQSTQYAGDTFRSDSMILTRVDPQNKKVTMVSMHRDTEIEIEGYGLQKLNASYAIGGPALAIKTVSQMAGVPISHYAEINFDGFEEVVDALGGVEVDVPMEINDDEAGGHVDAGVQTLSGEEALILCRSRHSYDEYGDGDRYRAANQRLVLGAIAQEDSLGRSGYYDQHHQRAFPVHHYRFQSGRYRGAGHLHAGHRSVEGHLLRHGADDQRV